MVNDIDFKEAGVLLCGITLVVSLVIADRNHKTVEGAAMRNFAEHVMQTNWLPSTRAVAIDYALIEDRCVPNDKRHVIYEDNVHYGYNSSGSELNMHITVVKDDVVASGDNAKSVLLCTSLYNVGFEQPDFPLRTVPYGLEVDAGAMAKVDRQILGL